VWQRKWRAESVAGTTENEVGAVDFRGKMAEKGCFTDE
jgi:hypothetical protein